MNNPAIIEYYPDNLRSDTAGRGDIRVIRLLIGVGLVFMAGFVWVYCQPENRGYTWLFGLLTVSVFAKLFRLLHEWYHYWQVVPPTPPAVTRTWTVDVLTTFCPGEPYKMLLNSLRAMQAITYPHTTYLCDEANDPYLRRICNEMGIRHITRADRTDAKAGNINHALQQATGEICLIIDPDHVPVPDFLDRVLPYFEPAAVGFVQCVQAYHNRKESLTAFAAAEQTYSFYGPMMTCMGHYGTAQAIGANCTFRRAALDSIGGHAAGLSEDMHTAMRLHAGGWQSVYVPLPLSYGLVPATLSAYCKQQLKWARGTFELLVTTYPAVFGGLAWRQRLHYFTLPLHYLLGLVQLIDLLIPILSLTLMRLPLRLELLAFAAAYLPLLCTALLIRQYAQRWLTEPHEAGFHLLGGILSSGTWWVYMLGLVYTVFRVEVPYLPTPKHDKPRNNLVLCLPNLLMILATLGAVAYGVFHYGRFAIGNVYYQLMIGFGLLNTVILSLNILMGQERLLAGIKTRVNNFTARYGAVLTLRQLVWIGRYGLYQQLRRSVIPLFGVILVGTTGLIAYAHNQRMPVPPGDLRHAGTQSFYLGIDPPAKSSDLSGTNGRPLLVPSHLVWPVYPSSPIARPDWPVSTAAIPVLYLEPSVAGSTGNRAVSPFLRDLLRGQHDTTLADFADAVTQYGRPVVLSVAPYYDDATRPWGTTQPATLALYREGIQYVVRFFRQHRVTNVIWLWCPANLATVADGYPAVTDVDWLGIEVIDTPNSADGNRGRSFASCYQLLHNMIRLHKVYGIRHKPVFITRLTTTVSNEAQWVENAAGVIREQYPEIRGVVVANPALADLIRSLP